MNRIHCWNFMIDIFKNRLSRWKASSLSIGGRVVLIKAVMESLPTYYFSLFIAPAKVINSLEGIIRRFLWGGDSETSKIHWVAWETVSTPTRNGGLGLTKLKEANEALIAKWLWRYRNEPENLWRKVIDAIHNTKRCWSQLPFRKAYSSVWGNIAKAISRLNVGGVNLNQMIKGNCRNGRNIRFWLDPWASTTSFKDSFPRLFKREKEKKCMVSDRFCPARNHFVIDPGGQLSMEEKDELVVLKRDLEGKTIRDGNDQWEWLGGNNKDFSVKGVKQFIRSNQEYNNRLIFKWAKWIPKKCNIFLWRLGMDRIATYEALKQRNCTFGSPLCELCGMEDESTEHLFCSCEVTAEVWYRISRWTKSPPFYMFAVKDLFDLHKGRNTDRRKRNAVKGIVFITCWTLWKSRNSKKFDNEAIDVKRIVLEIMSFGFLCFKNRGGNSTLSWENWCKFEL